MKRTLTVAWGEFLSRFSWGLVRDSHVSGLCEVFPGTQTLRVFRSGYRKSDWIPHHLVSNPTRSGAGWPVSHARVDWQRGELEKMYWVDYWNELAAIAAHNCPSTSGRGAAFYCAKYVDETERRLGSSATISQRFAIRQPVLPLEGARKPPSAPQAPKRVCHLANSRREFRQLPMLYAGHNGTSTRDSNISEVYRREVTRDKQSFVTSVAKDRAESVFGPIRYNVNVRGGAFVKQNSVLFVQ